MLRQNDPVLHHYDRFWEYVEKMDDFRMRCKFCGHVFAKDTAITRIKFHLARVKGRGVRICGQVPQDVQDAALAAIPVDGPPEKKLKTLAIAASSNNEVTNAISASTQQDLLLEDWMEPLQTDSFHERPSFNQANEPRGDPSQPANDQLCSPSVNDDVIVNDAQQREPMFTGEYDFIGGGIELRHYTPEINPLTEHANPETEAEWANEELPHDEFQTLPRTEPVDQVLEQSNAERDNLFVDDGRTQVGFQGMEQGGEEGRVCSNLDMENTGEGSVQHVDRIVSPTIDENYNRREATERLVQPDVGASSFGVYENLNAISSQQEQNNEFDNSTVDERASSFGGLVGNTNEMKGDALPTRKLVGQAFEDNKKFIWSLLMGNEVSSIGIYGMGGVGKTTLVTHLYNQLLERPETHVYWITASQDTNINRLQTSLARRIGLDLSNEDDELHRVVALKKELMKKQHKWVLILDDLWKAFDLQKLGILDQAEGCKLILTTRSKKICQQMKTQRAIKLRPILEDEAWTLFIERLGHDIALSPEVKRIAEDVVRECAGLPLGIIAMAGSMRGEDDPHVWRNTLEKLKRSKFGDMEDEVFRLLRFSYDRLDNNPALQQCLLYCAIFPEDYKIEREELIGYLIDEGIIEQRRSRQSAFDEGHTMLITLENICLLETATDYDDRIFVKMHDLMRDMAHQILQMISPVMVGEYWDGLPVVDMWKENLARVSLKNCHFQEIPSSHSPRCPNLSTLLLCDNIGLQFIADSFFTQLHGLKVLDLSETSINLLPDSVSELVSLTALLLKECDKLRHVPSLEKLRALMRLDLSGTITLKKMPQGMQCLSSLRYLRMNGCGEKEFPCGVLPKLSHLQVLILEDMSIAGRYTPVTIKGKEVGCLRELEHLVCHFEGQSDFMEYLTSRNKTQSLISYRIAVGPQDVNVDNKMKSGYGISKALCLGNLCNNRDGDFQVMFPYDIQQLFICKCSCDVSSILEYSIELEVIHIEDCNSMASLVSSSWLCSAPLLSPSYNGIFHVLKNLICYRCRSMKKLLPHVLLPNLVNLEMIIVEDCEKIEEIIGGTRSDEEGAIGEESSEFQLPKLRSLRLQRLPELKSICSAKLICESLQEIYLCNCNSMEILIPSSWSCLVNLEEINAKYCGKMKEIIGGTRSDDEGVMGEESSKFQLPKLRSLRLQGLPELKSICSSKLICDSLQQIDVHDCNNMEILVPSSWSCLVNLEWITVEDCEKMKEIIGGTRSDEEGVMGEESSTFKLPNLRELTLGGLPELKSICSAKLVCDSLQEIYLCNCNSMEILIPSSWSCLVNLEEINAEYCGKMKEIIGGTRSDEEGVMGEESSKFQLPKLRSLRLEGLPELKSNWSAKLICDSLQKINVSNCNSMEILVPSSWSCLVNLEEINVYYCWKMKEIIGGTRLDEEGVMGEESSKFKLPKLRELRLWGLPELKSICSSKLICNSLQRIDVFDCNSMEILVPTSWSCLVNLEKIHVGFCGKMEGIIGGTRSDEEGVMGEESISSEFKLPNLKELKLRNLPKLKSICSSKLICDSLEEINVQYCEKLKRMPICLPLLYNGEPSPPPSLQRIFINKIEWWEAVVEWEHPNAKDVLRPFVQIQEEENKGSEATAGSSNNDVADPVSASAEEQNYGGRHVEMAQQGGALSPGAIKDWMDSITDKETELMHDAFETTSNNDVADPVSASAEEQNYGGRHVEMAQQGGALSTGTVEDWMDSFTDKEIELMQDAFETTSNNDVADPVSASAEEQNYGGRHVEMAQQGGALSTGTAEDWMDSFTDKEIELMQDAFETIPRNRTSPASGER